MSIRCGVVMDPIESITPYKDTSLAMMLEAQRRGWTLRYLELGDLYLRQGEARGRHRAIRVRDQDHDYFELGEAEDGPLAELDVILMRKDPPVDSQFLYASYILEHAQQAGALVVNRPQSLRDANEKLFALQFPQCCGPCEVTSDATRLRAFVAEHGKSVLKPLHGMGGASIFVVEPDEANLSVIIETLTEHGGRYIMVQKFLPEIKDGDKRILMIDGEPVPYALARIPAAGETRGNLAAGGRGEGVALSDRDRWIAEQVGPTLREMGLLFVGLDVIGDFLTEINVTSPTCVRELDALYGINISAQLLDVIERRLR
ncbi:glutathione synthase [Alkalilimnicola sp. S0819]|uniref:glutathione synthase n=1 Tax=Alkalilimnicola sp. S0819 TaxID=2613922 RepID=UPI001261EFCA|nr:glutathione synthase [Alkalilimnicola sp. S0819]KAB7624470.1 glutathione synthase [Alkalilimnicola sp. S0819]MPQ16306.1 glutathione synthase [Alkalilimnicola sp. S0819]